MLHDFLISPKVFAIGCELKGDQLIAEMLYLREAFTQDTKINLYDGDRCLIATVVAPKTDINTHPNITLQICH